MGFFLFGIKYLVDILGSGWCGYKMWYVVIEECRNWMYVVFEEVVFFIGEFFW